MNPPVDIPGDLEAADTEALYALLGRCDRARYELADIEHRIQTELDAREAGA